MVAKHLSKGVLTIGVARDWVMAEEGTQRKKTNSSATIKERNFGKTRDLGDWEDRRATGGLGTSGK